MENNLFPERKIPQALIVRQLQLADFDEFLNSTLKLLICPKHGCNYCYWCKKIDNNSYFDLAIFDATSGIKKNDILSLISRFNKPGIELPNVKIYVIKNIEYTPKIIFNSLLKFIEEPPKNTYAIFTTKNYSAIPETIKSRCTTIFLSNNEQKINNFLNTTILNEAQKKIIKNCFYDLKELKNNINTFQNLYEITQSLQKNKISDVIECLNNFQKLSYQEINLFLEIIKNIENIDYKKVLSLQNNLYLKTNKTLIFMKIYELIHYQN